MHFHVVVCSRADQTPEVLLTPMQSTHFRGGDVTSPSSFLWAKSPRTSINSYVGRISLFSRALLLPLLAQIFSALKISKSNGQQR